MSVTVGDHRRDMESEIDPVQLADVIDFVTQSLALPAGDIEISLVNDDQIEELNRNFRKVDSPTNVLSFPHFEWSQPGVCQEFPLTTFSENQSIMWGEIIVSTDTVKREAELQGVSYPQELVRICIHGLLHLFGYDHESDCDYTEMKETEDEAIQFAEERMQQKKS